MSSTIQAASTPWGQAGPRRFERHDLRQGDDVWPVLVVAGGPPLSLGAVEAASLGAVGAPPPPDPGLLDALNEHEGVRIVVLVAPDLGLEVPRGLSRDAMGELGAVYVQRLLPTLAALMRRDVRMVVFASCSLSQIELIGRGRDRVLERLRLATDDSREARRERNALTSLPVWSSSDLQRILDRKLPALIPGLRVQRRRAATVPPAAVLRSSASEAMGSAATAGLPGTDRCFTATCGSIHLSHFTGPPTAADVARVHHEIEDLWHATGSRVVVLLHVATGVALWPADARARASAMFERLERIIDGMAVVLTGPGFWTNAMRGMFQGIASLSRSSYPWQAFADAEAAITWARSISSGSSTALPSSAALLATFESLRSRSRERRG